MGPIDGHNIENLCDAFESAKSVNGPVVLHVITVKGKGYEHAEKDPSVFHGISKFDIDTGEYKISGESFSDAFGKRLCELASNDNSICAITAAMGIGTGLNEFSKKYPDRFFDVGIAEEHAVTFASGLAKNNLKPIYAVYSTFLQRCYDQIVHDVSLQKQKIVFAIDRAGFVGEDGETHHGLFDVAFFNTIPDIMVYSPCCFRSLNADINNALYGYDLSVAVRYPRGSQKDNVTKLEYPCIEYALYGEKNAEKVIMTYGIITSEAIDAVDILKNKDKDVLLISLNQIKPIPEQVIDLLSDKKEIYFFEEGMKSGGVAEKLGSILMEKGIKAKYSITAVENKFAPQASINDLLRMYKLDCDSIINKLTEK
jgi:1-deoxy-D-xylulose-5-phosphate synthase